MGLILGSKDAAGLLLSTLNLAVAEEMQSRKRGEFVAADSLAEAVGIVTALAMKFVATYSEKASEGIAIPGGTPERVRFTIRYLSKPKCNTLKRYEVIGWNRGSASVVGKMELCLCLTSPMGEVWSLSSAKRF